MRFLPSVCDPLPGSAADRYVREVDSCSPLTGGCWTEERHLAPWSDGSAPAA